MTELDEAAPTRKRTWIETIALLVAAFRRRIDRTGFFPDLGGQAGADLRKLVREEGRSSRSYMMMCGLSAGIATLGLLQSSTAVVIGAMLVSPLMGPIASMGFGFASLDGRQIRDSLRVIAVGAAIGVLTGVLLTWLSPIRNATPEIIARTEPTLLDLAVAVFSGIAGAYATVRQTGATAIGVAIATALMPPLATLGYAVGVGRAGFAAGAFLLFLTNLAAIGFSFAVVARLSGAARPLAKVEVSHGHVLAAVLGFAALATPLAITLYRVTAEARAQSTVRQALSDELGLRPVDIAQLQVKWPLRSAPSVDAVVITRQYAPDAESRLLARLTRSWGEKPSVNLQQVVAADVEAQTRAIVDAAVQNSAAGIARDVPPLGAIREAIGLPIEALWLNRSERTVQVVPFAAEGWEIADFRRAEHAALQVSDGWNVRIVPPVQARLFVPLELKDGKPEPGAALDDALWAIARWGVEGIPVRGIAAADAGSSAEAQATALVRFAIQALDAAGLRAVPGTEESSAAAERSDGRAGVEFEIVRAPPRPAPAPPATAPNAQASPTHPR